MTAPDPDVPLIRQPLNMTDEVWECAACEAPVRQGSVKHAPDCAWLAGIREQAAADERERWRRLLADPENCLSMCDDDCENGRFHCMWLNLPNHKPGWHSPETCPFADLIGGSRCPSCGVAPAPGMDERLSHERHCPLGPRARCCDLHGRNCEPSELCCEKCAEAGHPLHRDGRPCSNLDLSTEACRQAVQAERSRVLAAPLDRFGSTIASYSEPGHSPEDRWDRGYQCAMREVARLLRGEPAYEHLEDSQ